MTDVFLESVFDTPIDEAGFGAVLEASGGCFGLYGVDWRRSCLAVDGRRTFCWFKAPDAESMRQALRTAGSASVSWPGTVHDAPGPDAPSIDAANVLVERRWDAPVDLDAIQSIEDEGAWCLETHAVRFVRTYFSRDQKRMICLYQAPDAEAVRMAQRDARMPVEAIWPFRSMTP
jgi:hypothetical protein